MYFFTLQFDIICHLTHIRYKLWYDKHLRSLNCDKRSYQRQRRTMNWKLGNFSTYCASVTFRILTVVYFIATVMAKSGDISYVDMNVTQTLVDITKENLLRAFGLNLNSKPNKPVIPHDYMIQVFSKLDGQRKEGQRDNINTVRGLVDNGQGGINWLPFPHLNIAFDMTGTPKTDRLVSSELRLLQLPSEMKRGSRSSRKLPTGSLLKVQLFGRLPKRTIIPGLQQNLSGNLPSSRMVLLDSYTLDAMASEQKWITFDVGSYVSKFRSYNIDTLRFMVRVTDTRTGLNFAPNAVGIRKSRRKGSQKPLLVLYMNDNSSSSSSDKNDISFRSKRGAARRGKKRDQKGHRRRRNKNLCRRRPMYVNFDDFGWTNWIIAPSGYQAYHCSGSCSYPIAAHLNPTNHATIQSIINSMDPNMVPSACCVPDKLSSISILYLDGNDRVVYKRKDDMVVERCGCK